MADDVRRVLVIVDQEDMRELARFSFAAAGGWAVSLAETAEEGLRKAREEVPDVILLDVVMDDMDGPAALDVLRADERTASIPVIFVTGKGHGPEADGLCGLPVAGVIAKPFDLVGLPAAVADVLARSA